MRLFFVIAAALLAFLSTEARAQDTSSGPASPTQASPAPESPTTASPAPSASPASPSTGQATTASPETVRVRHHGRRQGRSYGGLFRQWCAYNCYAVPPCRGPSCYGRYGYSHFAYDEDLPFPHRWDRDASPVDNVDAYVYRYTGEPVIRAFERIY